MHWMVTNSQLTAEDAFNNEFRTTQCSTSLTNTQSLSKQDSSIMIFAEVGLHNSYSLTYYGTNDYESQ